jgi:hypothetical protein
VSGPDLASRTLGSARVVALSLAGGAVLLAAAVASAPPMPRMPALVTPASLAGLVALPVALRLHRLVRDRGSTSVDPGARAAAYVRSLVVALGLTEVLAGLGAVAFLFTREPFCFTGLATHTILTGALWPTREAVRQALGSGDSGDGKP